MSCFKIKKSHLFGRIVLPPSKSHTLRAILFASLAQGTSTITNQLASPDTEAMSKACAVLGATISGNTVQGRGVNRRLRAAHVDAQNSGIVLRFVAAAAALSDQPLYITGDESIQKRRVVQPLIDGLQQLGGYAVSCKNNGFAPLSVCGPIRPGTVLIDGSDSQPVSALLIASALLEGQTSIQVTNLGERPWLMLTLDWLQKMAVPVAIDGNRFVITGMPHFSSFSYAVPGDLSTLSFLLVAALITESDLTIENVDLSDIQGDKVIVQILQRFGAVFEIDSEAKTLRVQGPQELVGCDVDVNDCIDALPILAVLACFARNKSRLYNGAIARYKESDRIHAIADGLSKMGASVTEQADGLSIEQSILTGAEGSSFNDHRIALSLAVAAMGSGSETVVQDIECVRKSYPGFLQDMQKIGANIKN